MTPHTHTKLVSGCYRCDLNRDEFADERALPDPNDPGITIEERGRRIGMEQNYWLHPDYTDRELRMLADVGTLVEWAHDVLPILRRKGVDYTLMPQLLRRIADEHGPWVSS